MCRVYVYFLRVEDFRPVACIPVDKSRRGIALGIGEVDVARVRRYVKLVRRLQFLELFGDGAVVYAVCRAHRFGVDGIEMVYVLVGVV